MKKTISILGSAMLLLMGADLSRAQLAPPNEAGVTMGHVHLNVRDVEVSKKFFLHFGGTPITLGKTEGIRYPGAILLLTKADPTGDMEGSAVDHIGFIMPRQNAVAIFTKFKDEGARIASNGVNAQGQTYGGYIYGPDGVKVEIVGVEDPKRSGSSAPAVPLRFDQVHFFVADPGAGGGPGWSELQSWYTKVFGANATLTTLFNPTPGNTASAPMSQSTLPGVNLRFSPASPRVATKGRTIDHIGFEVKNLQAFCKQLEANGIELDAPYRKQDGIGTAYLTDPAGTYIELTEGFDRLR